MLIVALESSGIESTRCAYFAVDSLSNSVFEISFQVFERDLFDVNLFETNVHDHLRIMR